MRYLILFVLLTASCFNYCAGGLLDSDFHDFHPRWQKIGCTININKDLTFEHPLILKPGTKDFVYPGKAGIELNAGSKLLLACPGNNNFINIKNKPQETEVECVGTNTFKSKDGEVLPFKSFSCADYPDPSAKKTGQKCSGTYTETEIGYQISTGFVRLFTTCFNEITMDSLYASYFVPASISQRQTGLQITNFATSDFYPRKLQTFYTHTKELATFNTLLGPNEGQKYIDGNTFYLTRGHLAARADFIYAHMQRCTYFLMNVAPQWRTFNAGNWRKLEDSTRRFIEKIEKDMIVITGTWGQTELPNSQNILTPLFLYVDGVPKLRVPKVYFKVLYEPVSKTGVAFVGHNNPHVPVQQLLCHNVCDQINWLYWDASNIIAGYSYCCEVDALRETVTYLPPLDVHGLLT